MRYFFAVIANHDNPEMAPDAEMRAIDDFNDRIERSGQRILAVGLADPSESHVFDFRGSRTASHHGPITVTDDFMIGFWVIEAESDSSAHRLAEEASHACNRRIEVRRIL